MKKRVGEILKFTVTVPLWLMVVAAAAIVIAVYFLAPTYRDDVKFVTALVAGAAAIYSAYYVGAGLRLNLERQKKQASFELLSMLNRPEFVEVRRLLDGGVEGHEGLSAVDLYQKIVGDPELENAVTIVLGFMEDTSTAIQHDFVSENVLYMSLCIIVAHDFSGLRGYIDMLRKNSDVLYYTEAQRLYASWQSGRRLSDGREVPKISIQ